MNRAIGHGDEQRVREIIQTKGFDINSRDEVSAASFHLNIHESSHGFRMAGPLFSLLVARDTLKLLLCYSRVVQILQSSHRRGFLHSIFPAPSDTMRSSSSWRRAEQTPTTRTRSFPPLLLCPLTLQWGNTALHVCVSDAKITSLLLIHGANPNLKNTVHSSSFFSLAEIPQDGETPLHAAAYRGELDTATLLVSHGALLDLRNNVTSPSSLLLSSCMTQTFFPLPHL
jgi:hypothetical protein